MNKYFMVEIFWGE